MNDNTALTKAIEVWSKLYFEQEGILPSPCTPNITLETVETIIDIRQKMALVNERNNRIEDMDMAERASFEALVVHTITTNNCKTRADALYIIELKKRTQLAREEFDTLYTNVKNRVHPEAIDGFYGWTELDFQYAIEDLLNETESAYF